MKRFLRFKYLLALIAVVFLLIKYKDYSSPVRINVFKFERFLNDDEVERVLVINKSLAQVTIKHNAIQTSKHNKGLSTGFLGSSNIKGPHYQFEVGSLEIFQTKLEEAKSKGIEFDYDFKTVEGISIGFSSPLQLIIIILTVVGLFAVLKGFSYKDFSEKLNGTLPQSKSKPLNKTNKNYLYFIIFIVVALILFEQTNKPSACECANLIAKNGFITYGDLKKYKSLDGGSNSSVYKEFEKTNNCTEIYDWEDLADCNIN